MMVHPSGFPDVVHCNTLAIAEMRVIFKGQTAHASALPWEGRNALDALVNLYTMIALNRQGMKPNMRVHGIVVDGGKAPNIIPDRAEGAFYLRAGDCADLEGLKAKTLNCIHAAALATGCEAEVVWEGANYLDLKTNPVLADLFTRVWSNPSLGTVQEQLAIPVGSTDMGNVCYAVPGIHPCYYIPCDKANHTVEFTHAAGSEEGLQRTLAVAKVMGHSLYLLLLNPSLLVEARKFYNYTGFDK
jgi:metal-dependent amidase/aminoacylase/carboxypeptidase family protein